MTRFIDKREKLVVLNSSFKDKSHCLNPGSEEEEETLHFKNSFLLKPVAWLFGRLTYNVQGPTFSSFTDEMPSWSYLPVKLADQSSDFHFHIYSCSFSPTNYLNLVHFSRGPSSALVSVCFMTGHQTEPRLCLRLLYLQGTDSPPMQRLPSYAGTPVYTSDVVLAREEATHHLTFIFLQTAGPDPPQIQRLGSLSKESVTGLSCSVACQAWSSSPRPLQIHIVCCSGHRWL